MKLLKAMLITASTALTLPLPIFGQADASKKGMRSEVVDNLIEMAAQALRPASENIWKTRPGKGGAPTEVSVGVFVIDIANITDVDHTFTVDFAMWLQWNDPRLAAEPKNLSQSHRKFSLHDVWNPQVVVVNQWDIQRLNEDVVEVDSEGTVIYRQRFQGALTFPIRLRDFPFDEHAIPIELASGRFDPEAVSFSVWEEQSGQRDTFFNRGLENRFGRS